MIEEENLLNQDTIVLIVYVISVIFILLVFVVLFFRAFQKRKNKLLIEQLEAKQRFERELASSQLEIQEQTLKNIAWELHDNIGQLLSVATMQLNLLASSLSKAESEKVNDTKEVVAQTVSEVRTLSKVLNSDVIKNNGLLHSIRVEMNRFNRLQYLEAEFKLIGDEKLIADEVEIIIFRILQEMFSNVMKHAKATKLQVQVTYTDTDVEIQVIDNGVGFNINEKRDSSGMHTMKSRADLIGASFELNSKENEGTSLFLKYNLQQ